MRAPEQVDFTETSPGLARRIFLGVMMHNHVARQTTAARKASRRNGSTVEGSAVGPIRGAKWRQELQSETGSMTEKGFRDEVDNGYGFFYGKHKGRFGSPRVMNRRSEGQHDYVDRQRYHVKAEISNFLGNLDLEFTLDWLYEFDKFFDIIYGPDEEQVKIVTYKLRGGAVA
ncbi:hypothetical protein Tco_0948129 [Tanacetum coccineum]